MGKTEVMSNVVTVGKYGIRIATMVGTAIAFGGAGMLGTIAVAGKCKHAVTQGLVIGLGYVGSSFGATAIAKATDDYICENYCLGD